MKLTKEELAELIGQGVHTGLRKYCDSKGSRKAWQAINDVPGWEWDQLCNFVAGEILKKAGLE